MASRYTGGGLKCVGTVAGVADYFPNFLWDQLLPQTVITHNILFQSNISPTMSVWEHCHGLFNFNVTPMGPIRCPIIIQNKPVNRKSWDLRGHKGFSIGPELNHYRCFHLIHGVTNNYSSPIQLSLSMTTLLKPYYPYMIE